MKKYSDNEIFIFIGSCIATIFFFIMIIITANNNRVGLCFLMLIFLVFSIIVFIDFKKIFYKTKILYPQKFKELNYLSGLSIKERKIYDSFNSFIKCYNDYIISKYKYETLVDYLNVHNSRIFKNEYTLSLLKNEKNDAYNKNKLLEEEIKTKLFSDEFDLNNYPLLKSKYFNLKDMCAKNLTNDISQSIKLFFKNFPILYKNSDTIVFMASGILVFNYNVVKIYEYNDLKIEFDYNYFKSSYFNSSYTFDHITYLHTTIRGTRDKRYNYNPSFYVYKKGIISLIFKDKKYKFENDVFTSIQYLYQSLFNFINDILSLPKKVDVEIITKKTTNKKKVNISKDENLTKHKNTSISDSIIINNEEITKNGKNYFSKNTDNIKELILSNDITEINEHAFKGCSKLEKIFFGEGIKKIGLFAFENCHPFEVFYNSKINNIGDYGVETNAIKKIHIGKNIKIINKYFNNLEEINFINPITGEIYESNIEDIRYNSFCGSFIKKLPLMPKLKWIGMNSFMNCSLLEEITISKNVEVIGTSAFENCTKLKKIIFESSDKELKILDYAFKNCTNLTEVIINRPISLIGVSAFKNCSNINRIYINNRSDIPLIIESEAFNNCLSLQEIKINSTCRICSNAFLSCKNLKNIYLKNNIELVESSFEGCSDIEKIHFFGDKEDDIDLNFMTKFFRFTKFFNNLVRDNGCIKSEGNLYLVNTDCDEFVIPEDVHTIKCNCFNKNKIKKIIVNNNVIKIENAAFNNLNDFFEIYIDSNVAEFEGKIFNKCDNFIVKCYRGSPISKYCQLNNYNREYLSSKNLNSKKDISNINCSNNSISVSNESSFENNFLDKDINNNIEDKNSATLINYPSNLYCKDSILIKVISPFLSDKIEIGGSGIKKIGINAFELNSENINEIIINDDVVEIHDYAFKNCKNLKKIKLSNNLNTIGSNTFEDCINLKEIVIPDKIQEIPYRTFYNCKNLKNIYFGDNVEIISTFAFTYCLPIELFINGKINNVDDYKIETSLVKKLFLSDKIEIINKNFNNLIELNFANPMSGEIYESNIVDISSDCFSGSFIKNIAFMPKLKTIGMKAFKDCSLLEEFTFSKDTEIIGSYSFENCSNIKKIIFEPSDKELKISDGAFKNCTNLTELIINRPISIGKYSFENCSNLKKVDICNKGNTHIGSNAFKNCISLVELNILSNIKLEDNSFNECFNIEKINISKSIDNLDDLEFILKYFRDTKYIDNLFDNDKCLKKDGVLYLSKIDCEEYEIPNDVHTIKSNCFNSNKISTLIIKNNVKKIEKNAFCSISKLSEVYIFSKYIQLENNIFEKCKNFVIKCYKDSSVSKYCNLNNYNKQFLIVNKTNQDNPNKNINSSGIKNDIKTINNSSLNLKDKMPNINQINENTKSLMDKNILCKNGVLVKIITPFLNNSIEIGGNGVNIIGTNSFSKNSSNITEIIFNNNVVEIYDAGFKNCINLENIIFPQNLKMLSAHAFEDCKNLKQIILPNNLKSIKYSTFSNCKKLKKLYFGDNIESIEPFAFFNCFPTEIYYNGKIKNILKYDVDPVLVKKLYIGENIEIIDKRFKNLEEIFFVNPLTGVSNNINITEIKHESFSGSLIKEVPLMPKLKNIEMRTFENCTLLEEVKISNNVELIGSSAFENCSKLRRIVFEKGDKELKIENNAFRNCMNLEEVIINRPVSIIGYNSFEDCSNLRKLHVGNNNDTKILIGANAFKNCISLEEIKILSNVKIWTNAFSGCKNLIELYFGKNIELSESSFIGCSNIEKIYISGKEEYDFDFITKYFRNTEFINKLLDKDKCIKKNGVLYLTNESCNEYVIPKDVHTIKSNCFYGNNISKIIIYNNVKKIESCAFNKLLNLNEIFIDSGVDNFENDIFTKCGNFVVKCYRGSPISKYCQLNNYNKEYLSIGETYNSREKILNLLLDNDTININSIDEKYRNQPIFNKILDELCSKYDIIEFEKDCYINFKKLDAFNISKNDIYKYCKKIITLSQNEYFTIEYMEKFHVEDKIVSLGFDNIFYISLLKYYKNINSMEYNDNYIFKFGSKKRLSVSDFIRELIEKNNIIETDKLHNIIENEYKIKVNKKDLKVFVKNSNIYYNETMDTFYKDYETFINEI